MDNNFERKLRRQEKSNKRWIIFWVIVFGAIAILLYVSIFSQNRIDAGSEVKVTKVDSLTCKIDGYLYPFLKYDESNSKELKVIISFMDDTVRTIFLQQVLSYDNLDISTSSEAINHGAMNEQFGADGMEPDALEASFSATSSGFRFGLRSDFDQLDEKSRKYFLLDNGVDYDYNRVKQTFEGLGMVCSGS